MKFGIRGLNAPEDLFFLFSKTHTKVQVLRQSISFQPPSLKTLYLIDEISSLCSICADTSQAIYNLSPNSLWREAALKVNNDINSLYSKLNNDKLYYNSLLSILISPVYSTFTESQKKFLIKLLEDFKKEGLHTENRNIPTMYSDMNDLAFHYMQYISTAKTQFKFMYEELEGVPIEQRPKREGDLYPKIVENTLTNKDLHILLKETKNAVVRKRAFEAFTTSCPYNELILGNLVEQRHKLAEALGFKSYSEFILHNQSFPTSPSFLVSYLKEQLPKIRLNLENELALIKDKKMRTEQEDRSKPLPVEPWDVWYYSQQITREIKEKCFPKFSRHFYEKNYFSLSNVLHGISILLSEIFGISARVSIASPEETWSNDIIKLELYDGNYKISTLYLDLFTRPHKFSTTAVKLNIQSSRQLSVTSTCTQKPIAILVCNFQKPESNYSQISWNLNELSKISINFTELTELFHELGHSLHTVLSTSEFQSFSGTRVPLDLAEVPSHLFELFLEDYNYTSIWAKHCSTSESIPKEIFQFLVESKYSFKGLAHLSLLYRSIFDLTLHTNSSLDSTAESLQSLLPINLFPKGWYNSFYHLGEYGSSYYSYVLGQVLSNIIFKESFDRQTLNSSAGKVLRNSLLGKGGEYGGNIILGEMLAVSKLPGELVDVECEPWSIMSRWYDHFSDSHQLVLLDSYKQNL